VNYILAGIWAFITLVWCYVFVFLIEWVYKHSKGKTKIQKIILTLFSMLLYSGSIIWLCNGLQIKILDIGWIGILVLFLGISLNYSLVMPITKISRTHTKILSEWGNPFKYIVDRYDLIIGIMFCFITFFTFLFSFGKYVYDHIPSEIGGGQPKYIVIIPKPNATN